MIKTLTIIFLALALTGCGSLGRKPQVAPIVIEKRVQGIPVFHPPLPDPIKLKDVTWKVLTPDIVEEYLKDLKSGTAPTMVWYGLTPQEYKDLAEDMAILKRYIKEQKAIIEYYRENIHEMVPESKKEE